MIWRFRALIGERDYADGQVRGTSWVAQQSIAHDVNTEQAHADRYIRAVASRGLLSAMSCHL